MPSNYGNNNNTFRFLSVLYLGLLKDSGVIHGQLTGHTLYKESTSDGNQREATAKYLQLPYRCYDIITATTTALTIQPPSNITWLQLH